MNILLVEDNITIIKGLIYTLENNNLKVEYKTTIKETKAYLENNKPSLIILDVTLPDGNGFNLYQDIIKEKEISTIFLTALDDEDDIVKGLNLGAEDYIVKPFSTKELVARINRILNKVNKYNIIKVKNITYDIDKMKVFKEGVEIKFTSLELKIVNLLFLNINRVVSRNLILDKIWEWTGNDVDDHTITVYMKRIREKLNNDIIETVKGIGYIINGK